VDESFQQKAYPLRLTIKQISLMVGMAVVFGVACGVGAANNEAGMRLLGFIELSPKQATRVLWGMAAFFGLGLLPLALATGWKGTLARQRIEFTDQGIWLPETLWSSHHVLVPFQEVEGIRIVQRPRQQVLELTLTDRRFWIAENWLSSPDDFGEILLQFLKVMEAKPTGQISQDDSPPGA
jgi:hypothetical protein